MLEDAPHRTHPQLVSVLLSDLVRRLVWGGQVRMRPCAPREQWCLQAKLRLLDSIRRGIPIGTLVLWDAPDAAAVAPLLHRPELASEASGPPRGPVLIADGRQRALTLAWLLCPSPPGSPVPAYFDLDHERFVTEIDSEDAARWLPLQELHSTMAFMQWSEHHLRDRPPRMWSAHTLSRTLLQHSISLCLLPSDWTQAEVHEVVDRMTPLPVD